MACREKRQKKAGNRMVKPCFLAAILMIVLPFKIFSETQALQAIHTIEFAQLELYDELEKYQVTFGEVKELIDEKFFKTGLDPDPEWSGTQDPAQLDVTILTKGNTVFIEVELTADACFLPSRVYTHGTIWKKWDILTDPSRDNILLSIGNNVNEILQLYIASR
jgi:hypothetical protein